MSTTNTDFLPNTTGLNLGSPDQMWDGFFDDLTVNDTLIANGGVTIATGNATKLQGFPISTAAPALNQALVWNGSVWIPANQSGGGGGASLGYVTTVFSATPTFTPFPIGSCAFSITLTGNVTSSTFDSTALTAGTLFTFILRQDGAGGHTFVWPAQTKGASGLIGTAANQINVQSFLWDGANLLATAFLMSF